MENRNRWRFRAKLDHGSKEREKREKGGELEKAICDWSGRNWGEGEKRKIVGNLEFAACITASHVLAMSYISSAEPG